VPERGKKRGKRREPLVAYSHSRPDAKKRKGGKKEKRKKASPQLPTLELIALVVYTRVTTPERREKRESTLAQEIHAGEARKIQTRGEEALLKTTTSVTE